VAAGFDPLAFWRLSPRLYLVHMKGARQRLEREDADRRAQAWFTAFLPGAKEPPSLVEFVTGEKDREARRRKLLESWDKMDRALARNKG
jgi:hypothetical protein